jgi:hypothetical protein
MEKVISFLERNVQWVVLGIAAVWLLYMAWSYVATPPAIAIIEDKTHLPGSVDRHTAGGVAKDLQLAMADGRVPTFEVQEFTQAWLAQMAWANSPTLAMADSWIASKPGMLALPGRPDQNTPSPTDATASAVTPTDTPTPSVRPESLAIALPAARPLGTVQVGRSIVVKDSASSTSAVRGQTPSTGDEEEEVWVTAVFQIPMDSLKTQFRRAALPERVTETAFIDVDLIREEQLPDGTWANQTVVTPIAGGATIMPLPPGGNRNAELAYLSWAVENPKLVLRPPFYEVVRGKKWDEPNAERSLAGFDPATFKGDLDSLTSNQRQLVLDARRSQAAQEAEQRQAANPNASGRNAGPTMGPGGPGGSFGPPSRTTRSRRTSRSTGTGSRNTGGRRSYAPEDSERAIYYQSAGDPRGTGGGFVPIDIGRFIQQGMRNSGARGPGATGATGAAGRRGTARNPAGGLVRPPVEVIPDNLPEGEFNPLEWKGPNLMTVWAHDDTVVDGHTYRYKIRYRMKNPVYMAKQFAPSEEIADQLALISADSAWTGHVDVPQMTDFFLASGRTPGQDRIRVEVFTWDDGTQLSQQFEISPGDTVGRRTATADYTTQWVLVDVTDTDDVLLANAENGQLMIRNFRNDQSNPLYRQLKQEASESAGSSASAR